MKILGLKNCDNCRKARRALPAAEFVDIRDVPLTLAEITDLFQVFGDDLVNRKSTTWRGLSEVERAADPVTLLGEHPALMKRPVILDGSQAFLGWSTEVRDKIL